MSSGSELPSTIVGHHLLGEEYAQGFLTPRFAAGIQEECSEGVRAFCYTVEILAEV